MPCSSRWLLVRQECPACHKMQIPRVDILNPTNNVEGHIAFLTEVCAPCDAVAFAVSGVE